MKEKILLYNSREGDDYPSLEQGIKNTFEKAIKDGTPLFTTDATGLFNIFLENIPEEARQHYTCNACRHFVERYGGLVTISDDGKTRSAMWSETSEFFIKSVKALWRAVEKAKVTGVFISKNAVLGTPVTGEWTHMSVALPENRVYKERVFGIDQVIAEKKADFIILNTGLAEYPLEAVEQACSLLNTESLYRSEKVSGVTNWLRDLHVRRNQIKNKLHKDNITWLAVAQAPPGYVHVKSSMIGTLLDDIVAGLPFETVSRRFSEKMSPLQYQRPQAAPSSGNIEQAEKLVEKLGIQKSLVRRFARLDEIQTIWKPIVEDVSEEKGVFSHLKAKKDTPKMELPTKTMTWKKFSETVLPSAKNIEILIKNTDNFSGILTAQYREAPPIIQWDGEGNRNPFSSYVYSNFSSANNWNLTTGYRKVTGICYDPCQWQEGFEHHQENVLFIVEGAKDRSYETSGNALFPEILKNEFRGIRSTIEAYSRSAKIYGYEDASACGVRLQKGVTWSASVRVETDAGIGQYILDRWD